MWKAAVPRPHTLSGQTSVHTASPNLQGVMDSLVNVTGSVDIRNAREHVGSSPECVDAAGSLNRTCLVEAAPKAKSCKCLLNSGAAMQSWASYGSGAKFSPQPVFVNKALFEQSHAHVLTYCDGFLLRQRQN